MTADAQISPRVLLIGRDETLDESLPAALVQSGLEVERADQITTEAIEASAPALVILFENDDADASTTDAFVRDLPKSVPVIVLSETASLGLESTAKRLPRDASPAAIAFRAGAMIRASRERQGGMSYRPPRPSAEPPPSWTVLKKTKAELREPPGRSIKSSLPAPPPSDGERTAFGDSERPTAAYPRAIESLPPAPRRPSNEIPPRGGSLAPRPSKTPFDDLPEEEEALEVAESELRDVGAGKSPEPSTFATPALSAPDESSMPTLADASPPTKAAEPETRAGGEDAVEWWEGGSSPHEPSAAPKPSVAAPVKNAAPGDRSAKLLPLGLAASTVALVVVLFFFVRGAQESEEILEDPRVEANPPAAPEPTNAPEQANARPPEETPKAAPEPAAPRARGNMSPSPRKSDPPAPATPPVATTPSATPRELPADPKAASDRLVLDVRSAIAAGDLSTARPVLEEAIALDPTNPRPYEAFARLHLVRKEAEAALEWIAKALKRRPKRAAYHVMHGDALALTGNAGGARKAWEKALALDPGDRDARARLAGK